MTRIRRRWRWIGWATLVGVVFFLMLTALEVLQRL